MGAPPPRTGLHAGHEEDTIPIRPAVKGSPLAKSRKGGADCDHTMRRPHGSLAASAC